jgi:hypothetical protein
MTSRQLVDFVEAKLKQHGISKVIPDKKTLARTYELFAASERLSEAFEETKEELEKDTEAPIKVPDDLEAKVAAELQQHPDITWHRAVRLLVDPDAPEDDDDDDDDDDDGEYEDDTD